MDSEIIRRKVKQLEGKHITTIRGAVFHVYRVDDNAIFYDPLSTRSPGTHWTFRSTIMRLSDEIQTGRRSPPEVLADIEALCEELRNQR